MLSKGRSDEIYNFFTNVIHEIANHSGGESFSAETLLFAMWFAFLRVVCISMWFAFPRVEKASARKAASRCGLHFRLVRDGGPRDHHHQIRLEKSYPEIAFSVSELLCGSTSWNNRESKLES